MSLEKTAAIDSLVCSLYDTFRSSEEGADGGQPMYSVGAMLPMKKTADAPDDVVDMSTWPLIDSHVRKELNLDRLHAPQNLADHLFGQLWSGNRQDKRQLAPVVGFFLFAELETPS